MSFDFPHRLVVTRASTTGGAQDPDTGVFVPGGTDTVIYDGAADVQDAGEAVPRTFTGQAVKEADATAFLLDEATGLDIEPGDVAVVHYPDGERTAEGEVLFVRELDGTVLIRYR